MPSGEACGEGRRRTATPISQPSANSQVAHGTAPGSATTLWRVVKRNINLPGRGPTDVETVGFRSISDECWSEYILDDGSTLKVKTVLTDVYKIIGEFDFAGNPVYISQTNNVVSVDAPDEIRKPREQ